MIHQFSRLELLIGTQNLKTLSEKRVAVFGIGGVGSYACESLVRAGIGAIDIIDNDKVSLTNINRQLIATLDTIGQYKTDVMEARIHTLNPNCIVTKHTCFYLPEKADEFDFSSYDYVVDAIDTVTAKLDIIQRCQQLNIPIICAMGCGNRLDPTRLTVTDLYRTEMDPLAKIMRRECKKRGIRKLKVVYSTEKPLKPIKELAENYSEESIGVDKKTTRRDTPGSSSFVPPAAGYTIGSVVVRDLLQFDPENRG